MMQAQTFDNENRRRCYGLRKGDLVELQFGKSDPSRAEVIGYCPADNNRVRVRLEGGTETEWVAEWCKITTKVEERGELRRGENI